MSFLGDSFPNSFRRDYSNRNIKAGTVLRTLVLDTKPPKIKRFIIIGVSSDGNSIGIVYINTEINPNVFPTKELKDLHLPIDKDDRGIVDYLSYIDCSRIYERDKKKINELVANDPRILIGELTQQEKGSVISKLASARTISLVIKKKYGVV